MAKNLAAVQDQPTNAVDPDAPPEGFEQASGDIAGDWESASPESRTSEEKHGSGAVLLRGW